ncbi:MAG TPA: chorismate mutase [Planctomycetota bacterium]|nr:chorismate mutase [Planctomycetota bacterium]
MRKKGGPGGIANARKAIERIDAGLLRLLNRRAALVAAVHARKTRAGTPIYDPLRTDAILDRLVRLNRGPLREEQVLALFSFLLHHFALGHRPGRPPAPPLFLAELAPGADPALLRRHGLTPFRKSLARGLVDARAERTRSRRVLKGLLDGARGAILRLGPGEDDEALAQLCYRAKLLCLALRAGGGR